MSWRNFLTPYGEKYLISKEEDQSISRISQNSCSPIHGMIINKSKSSLDISHTLIQHDISKLLNNNHHNLPNNLKNSNNGSYKKNKSELDDNTYNISITQDPFENSSNTSYNLQNQQKPAKYENKLAKIKDEMSKLKIELSKFPKKNGRKNSESNSKQTTIQTEGNFRRVSNENVNPILSSHRQSLQNIKKDNMLNEQQLMLINQHRNSLQLLKSGQDLSLTNKDELSFSQNKQIFDHDSFITEDDIQQISDSLQDHLSNYSKVNDKLNAVHHLNGQLAQFPQHAISQLTTTHLNSLLPTQQNTLKQHQFSNTSQRKSSDKEIQTISFKEQDNNAVSNHQLDHQKSTEYNQKISILKQDRNQLLEALENVLKVIGKDKTKSSDSKQINQFKDCLKEVKKVKKSFKQEFLGIGHIEPLNLSYKKELDSLINYSSVQSLPKDSIKNSPNSYQEKQMNGLTKTTSTTTPTVPQYYFMPLQQNKNKSINNNSKQIISPLLETEEVNFRQNIPTPLHLSQKSQEIKQKISTSPQHSYQMKNNPINNLRSNFNQINQNNEFKQFQNIISPSISLVEQYKQQQLERQKPFDNQQKQENSSFNRQSLTPRKQEENYPKESVFNTRISPNQLFKQQHTSPPNKEFNQTNIESNYQTFQQQEHYQPYYDDSY